jgi:hypothetical protein
MSDSKPTVETKIFGDPVKDISPQAMRELIEKNIKWSHLIYEQVKKNNKRMTLLLIFNGVIFLLILLQAFFGPNISITNIQKSLRSASTTIF